MIGASEDVYSKHRFCRGLESICYLISTCLKKAPTRLMRWLAGSASTWTFFYSFEFLLQHENSVLLISLNPLFGFYSQKMTKEKGGGEMVAAKMREIRGQKTLSHFWLLPAAKELWYESILKRKTLWSSNSIILIPFKHYHFGGRGQDLPCCLTVKEFKNKSEHSPRNVGTVAESSLPCN